MEAIGTLPVQNNEQVSHLERDQGMDLPYNNFSEQLSLLGQKDPFENQNQG